MSSVGVGGAWKEIVDGTAVGVSGAWKTVEAIWVGVSGAWEQVFEAITLALDSDVNAADLGGGLVGYVAGVGGSMVDDDYVDDSSTTRTIVVIVGDGGADTITVFALQGTSIPDTDDTFVAIECDSVFFYRTDATYDASDGGNSSWTWSNGAFVGGAGTHNLRVHI